MNYKIHIIGSNYSEYELFDSLTLKPIIENIENFLPHKEKLFSNDLFNWNNNQCSIIHSTVRSGGNYPGVLVLDGNKTYGRYKKKMLYKCIPDDKRLPIFLVPYEGKLGFSKKQVNKYITFQYKEWNKVHPLGIITNIIGTVDELDNFYEYQLFCKSLNDSIQKFTKTTHKALKQKTEKQYIDFISEAYPSIEDRTSQNIITIDPPQSKDFDDAIGILDLGENEYILSIYIANVALWMEVLDLWESFSKRVSTIYLPDRKRPMLPSILSDSLCSLQEKEVRISFVMDICIKNDDIHNISFCNSLINVTKNYRYDDKTLLDDCCYQQAMKAVNQILEKNKYLDHVKNSHDLVTYTMILMNHQCAKQLVTYKEGIYRSLELNSQDDKIPSHLPKDIKKHMTIWYCTGGQYKKYGDNTKHELIADGLKEYIHITSPIRRLVDLLNIFQLQESLGLISYSNKAKEFYKKWMDDMDYINITMRAIRRVQNDCSLLNLCFTNNEILEQEYEGYIFDCLERNDGLFQYIVYLPEIKINSRFIYQERLENYKKGKFKIYTFTDENSLKRKIRLQLIK
jgi:exoribonuclease R